ncbi:hypothetical protein L1987_43893 [Smallanthus sonchifolius]|uniref:Uncharacterized protein n=1 Tax=Smallanthus sonchifolius TaxID=185202 RepID=A0ACB9GNZ7_9ASTR|nr:hypothetical protein L1987_43893 [Smallanthus sonchifolius]
MDVRPMMEVVKGAVFGILQAAGGCPTSLRPGRRSMVRFIQCTGSVGIEAISGGCFEVHFWEMDPWVVSDVLRPNLEWTGFLDNSVIHTAHVETYLKRTKGDSFEYISVTPPYMLVDYEILMKQISESSVIGDDSLLGAIPPTARKLLTQDNRLNASKVGLEDLRMEIIGPETKVELQEVSVDLKISHNLTFLRK